MNHHEQYEPIVIRRMTDDDEYTGTTPRPGTSEDYKAAAASAAAFAIQQWRFSQCAKQHATEMKRRRSRTSRTFYRISASFRVKRAFDELQEKRTMTDSDFNLLKQAINNFSVRLVVHDSNTFAELKQMCAEAELQEEAAAMETQNAFLEKRDSGSGDSEAKYLNAKNKYLDLKNWKEELAKYIRTIEPKPKFGYIDIGGGLWKHTTDSSSPPPPCVPSQHAQIAQTSGFALRNILTPETIRRRFISLNALTQKIREELAAFLTDESRSQDRAEVVKQIKESCRAKKNNN